METISGKNVNLKKENKENTKPTTGSTKSFIKSGIPKTVSVGSVHQGSKSGKKETMLGQEETKNGQKGTTAREAKKRNTLSQAFLTRQAVSQKRLVAEAPKLPAPMPPKPAPGTYKGRVVQSKIGAIWKSSSTSLEGGVDSKATTKTSAQLSRVESQRNGNLTKAQVESQKNGNLTKTRSKSIADLPRRGTQKPIQHQPSRSKSVADGPFPVSKFPAASRTVPSHSARTASSGTLARPNPSKSAMISNSKESKSSKPKVPVTTDNKVRKPPVSSTLSQYRTSMETAEERRAKLAEWLLSKGKTLKRPPVSSAAPPKTRPTKESDVRPTSQSVTALESHAKPQPAAQSDAELQADPLAPGTIPASQPEEDNQGHKEETACGSSPLIMNSTLDLLENSSMDLPVDPEVRLGMDEVMINLCDALEALETSSACVDVSHEAGEFDEKLVDGKPDNIKLENVEVKREAGGGTFKKDMSYVEEVESDDDDDDDDDVMQTTPETEGASVVKYSVKTTPYLQRVKRTIEGEAGSRQKSTIKDLKFLTPVRRSCRIQRNSSCLPDMLTDHDPCVSSLAELVQLDDDANAYIYRKNPALLEELPDHPKDLERI